MSAGHGPARKPRYTPSEESRRRAAKQRREMIAHRLLVREMIRRGEDIRRIEK